MKPTVFQLSCFLQRTKKSVLLFRDNLPVSGFLVLANAVKQANP
jgi:hypothetical protein